MQKKLIQSSTVQTLYIYRDILESEGVRVELRNENIGAAYVGQFLSNVLSLTPAIWVSEADYPKAKKILDDMENSSISRQTPWQCQKCSEKVESGFLECWNCGTEKFAQKTK